MRAIEERKRGYTFGAQCERQRAAVHLNATALVRTLTVHRTLLPTVQSYLLMNVMFTTAGLVSPTRANCKGRHVLAPRR